MKLNGIFGKGSGKVGESVWAVSGGVQIVRPYNPNVTNPNTSAQVEQRAKFKLMSQLAVALSPAIAFRKQGLVSARNQFVSKNIGSATFANNQATADLTALQLTPSNVALPSLAIGEVGQGTFSVALATGAASDIKRVAYFVYKKAEDDTLQYVASQIIDVAGNDRKFPANFNNVEGDLIVYAYGIKDNSAEATLKYENYMAEVAGDEAMLNVVSLFRSSAYGLTQTQALILEVQ